MTRLLPLLLMLLSPSLASGQVLMVKAAPAESPSPTEPEYSITDGLLTADVGDGSHQAHVRWDVPTVANMPDLKGYQISFGTGTGDYDLMEDVDLTAELQPGANEILVTGLGTSTTYYWRVRAIDSEGNLGSWCDEEECTSEAAWTAPGSPTDLDDSDFPITLAGSTHYRLTENITVDSGTALTISSSSSGASLDFNGFTITGATSGEADIVAYGTNAANTRLYDSVGGGGIISGSQSWSNCIYIGGALGTGNIIQDIELEYNGLMSHCIEFANNGNGIRIFNVTFSAIGGDSPSDTSAYASAILQAQQAYIYGCDFSIASDDGRTYGVNVTVDWMYLWECDVTVTYASDSSTINSGFFLERNTSDTYLHDLTVDVIANRTRVIFFDGPDGTNSRVLWSSVDMTSATNNSTAQAFGIRNDLPDATTVKNCAVGFCSVEMGGNTAGAMPAFWISGTEWTDHAWENFYIYHTDVTNVGADLGGMRIEGDNTNLFMWEMSYTKGSGFTGPVFGWGTTDNPPVASDYYWNNVTITGSGTDVDANEHSNVTFHTYNGWTSSDADVATRIVDEVSWTGYDPNSGSVPTPTGMEQVTGVH